MPRRVERRERREHLARERHRLGDGQRSALQAIGERLALQQLHGDEQLAAVLADLVDLAHVRVVDARRGARLAPEALAGRLVGLGDRLDRDLAPEALVLGREDDAHAALPEPVEDAVAAEPLRVARRPAGGSSRAARPPAVAAAPSGTSPRKGAAWGPAVSSWAIVGAVAASILGPHEDRPVRRPLPRGDSLPGRARPGRRCAARAAGAAGEDSPRPTPLGLAIGFVTNFFDTLGIGSFAPTTAIFKFTGLVRDERIPGTLNVGHTAPTLVEALHLHRDRRASTSGRWC